jgi:hypothetical protein
MYLQYVPVTPTTKSLLPASRSFSIAFKPDNTGIWLSKNMTWYLMSSLFAEQDCSVIEPLPAELSVDGVQLLLSAPKIISSASSPFSAVDTLHPSRDNNRFMSIRVKGSSSTTRACKPGSKMVGLPDDFLEWVRPKGICGGVGGVVVTGAASSKKDPGLGNSTYVGRSTNRGLVVSVDDFSSRGGCFVELP